MTENNGKTLLVLETQGVKSWLFASPILRETRGASVLLDIVNRKKIQEHEHIQQAEIIYLGGGSGKIIFATREDAEQGQQIIEAIYHKEAPSAKISIHLEPIQGSFSKAVSAAVVRCREKKQAGGIQPFQIAGRWLRPCSSCGSQPAERKEKELGSIHFLCAACCKKREQVTTLYQNIKPSRLGHRPLKAAEDLKRDYMEAFLFTTLAQQYEKKYPQHKLYLPQSINDIGQASHPENYMGFIYADGDRMGEMVQKMGEISNEELQIQAYKEFSRILDQATREAAVEAVFQNLELSQHAEDAEGKFLPAEFLMAGGDDLMLLVPAHAALDIALSFMELFQKKSKELFQKSRSCIANFEEVRTGLTCSAGIVLSHTHYPVSELMDFAADLMKNAKKKSVAQDKRTGVLDFMVLAESSSKAVAVRRREEYEQKTLYLTERPYTVAKCHELLRWIRESKAQEMPRNKLIALYAALFKNSYSAQFEALNIRQRLQDTGNLPENSTLYTLFCEVLNRFPYRQHETEDTKWTSPLSEFIELYDFIQKKEARDENMDLHNGVS